MRWIRSLVTSLSLPQLRFENPHWSTPKGERAAQHQPVLDGTYKTNGPLPSSSREGFRSVHALTRLGIQMKVSTTHMAVPKADLLESF